MRKNSNEKKTKQLGMPVGTASNQLRKNLLFAMAQKLGENYCFQCGAEIESAEHLSIEHKIPYLDSENPKELFFSLDNIAFSHLKCNVGAARQTKTLKHPSTKSYAKGCRCEGCKTENTKMVAKYRANKK